MSWWFLFYFIYVYESVKCFLFTKTLIAFCLLNLIDLIYDSFIFDLVILCKHVQNVVSNRDLAMKILFWYNAYFCKTL